jgi:high-affinity nickel permease
MNAILILAFALGMRHAVDPDHLAAIDGLSRIRPKATDGLYFAIGQRFVAAEAILSRLRLTLTNPQSQA